METQKNESPVAAGQFAHQDADAGAIVARGGDDEKVVDTLIARFALMGHAVHRLADGGFLVERWGLTRHCADVTALQAFLVQIGGRP